MPKDAARNALRPGVMLGVFAAGVTAMLVTTFDMTRHTINQNQQRAKLALIAQLLPPTLYDNDLLSSTRQIPANEMLGTHTASTVWIASKRGRPTGLVLETIAPDGYSGEIALLIGINVRGEITGVRVTAHRETPGLGDYIEIAKTRWITQFNGKSLTRPDASLWKVKPDGGDFDARAGASITPRAVVEAVKSALQFFVGHRAELLTLRAPA